MISKLQITKTFIDLVTIDSLSGKEAKVATYIVKYLKNLKIKVVRDKYKNVLATIPGIGEPLLLCAHMDTVEPGRGIKPIVKNNIIKSDGTTVLGGDDKAGITEILEAVKYLKQKKISHRALELIFTREEETTFAGSLNLNYKKIKSKEALILDLARIPGNITMASPFIYIIDIKVKGRAAHAGSFPEKGINAISVASSAIAELKIGRINKSTTSNIGTIKGGVIRNGVPELVTIRAEVRSFKQESALKQVDIINKAFKKAIRRYKAKLVFKVKLDCHGYSHLRNNKLVKQIAETNKLVKVKTSYIKSGGVSDANVFMMKNINTVDIAIGGKNIHSTKESIKISEMQTIIEFLIAFCS
jgi:tripeptide aminopeptidase